jgi:hypothetical protein
LKIRCTLAFRCRTVETARMLAEVLSPDNRSVPKEQSFTQSLDGAVLTFRLEAGSTPSLSTTVASLLSDAGLFQEVWLLSRDRQAKERGTC